ATAMIPDLLMQDVAPEQVTGRWLGRISMILIFAVAVMLIRIAWRRRPSSGRAEPDTRSAGVAR
ncbi:MAG TPA: hypothetical protein VFZ18_01225, partial [Longimicrobiaceae bacterium]